MSNGEKLKELRGSRPRCISLTGMARKQAADALTAIAAPFATVSASDTWMPQGLLQPGEARIDKATPGEPLFDIRHRAVLQNWWLEKHGRANTPNWDIVSSCSVDGTRGVLLVEAKAHAGELSHGGKRNSHAGNHTRIGEAIAEANAGLNSITPGWNLTRDSHYQVSNRFAWGWKLASLGVPVVLVYLGFRNAVEMKPKKTFATHSEWEDCVREHTKDIVPQGAWGMELQTPGAVFIPVIASLELGFS